PWLPGSPARVAEVIADRGQRIGFAVPQVGLPVAIAVAREAQVYARQELRIAKRAGPAADEARARDAAVDHLERGNQFAFEQVAASPVPCERREGPGQVEPAHDRAVARFMA